MPPIHSRILCLCVYLYETAILSCIIQHFGFAFRHSRFAIDVGGFLHRLSLFGKVVRCGWRLQTCKFLRSLRVIQCIVQFRENQPAQTKLKRSNWRVVNVVRWNLPALSSAVVVALCKFQKCATVISVQVLQTSVLFMCFIVCFWWQIFPCHCEFNKKKTTTTKYKYRGRETKTNSCLHSSYNRSGCVFVHLAVFFLFYLQY